MKLPISKKHPSRKGRMFNPRYHPGSHD